MHYFKIAFAVTAAALSVNAQEISAQKTVSNIDGITSMSSDLDKTAKTVTLLNGFQTGPEVIDGFHAIVKKATKDYNEMTGSGYDDRRKREAVEWRLTDFVGSPAAHAMQARQSTTTYTTTEQDAVCNSFVSFVKVHQALLSTIIGKHGILEATGVAYQMAAVLRGVEGVVDEIAFTLIGEVPHCAEKAKVEKKDLDKSLAKSIDTYANGLP